MKVFRPNFFFIHNDIKHNKSLAYFYYLPLLSFQSHQSKSCKDFLFTFQPYLPHTYGSSLQFPLVFYYYFFLNAVPYFFFCFCTMVSYLFFSLILKLKAYGYHTSLIFFHFFFIHNLKGYGGPILIFFYFIFFILILKTIQYSTTNLHFILFLKNESEI